MEADADDELGVVTEDVSETREAEDEEQPGVLEVSEHLPGVSGVGGRVQNMSGTLSSDKADDLMSLHDTWDDNLNKSQTILLLVLLWKNPKWILGSV